MEVISIALVILTASLVGSGHCVGMCGPFAILASRGESQGKWMSLVSLGGYHLGRLLTYVVLGTVAGAAGSLVDLGGDFLGWQRLAAWITGFVMIGYGFIALLRLSKVGSVHFGLPTYLGNLVQRLYRVSGRFQGMSRSVAIGGVTALLPCGWLYAFLLIALGTSQPLHGAGVMVVFWMGTVPLLSLFEIGVHWLTDHWKRWIPTATAVLLIVSGFFTISVRAHAVFDSIDQELAGQINTVEAVNKASQTPLPCCHSQSACD
ncbi:sulfite exporter TauE/SafE family protein [Bremerella sp. JC817]|uniref:sulfite exporter TauE/SafE family protein n=1 Tax=Bremerella sp. JC817 TaxID=3231756 RepID=UPI0034596AE7